MRIRDKSNHNTAVIFNMETDFRDKSRNLEQELCSRGRLARAWLADSLPTPLPPIMMLKQLKLNGDARRQVTRCCSWCRSVFVP